MEDERNLPMEVVGDILSWLPAKSLCRFRCVSKPWLSLLTDPAFVKLHYNKTLMNEDMLNGRRRLVMNETGNNALYSFHLDQFLSQNDCDDLVVNDTEIDCVYSSEDPENGVMLVSSCNGLLFFALHSLDLCLLNPTTKESKRLSTPPEFGVGVCNFDLFGFGFDHSADDHKVVYGRCFEDRVEFGVFMVKAGTWRVIGGQFPYRRVVADDSKGMVANGGFHWLTKRVGGESVRIMAFLLEEEEVREFEIPRDFDESDCVYYCLGALRGCLCISQWILEDAGDHHQFWIMKEYGVRESWTKIKISISMLDSGSIIPSPYRKDYYDLLVAKWKCELYLYNFNDQSFRTLALPQFHEIRDAEIYVESLASLN